MNVFISSFSCVEFFFFFLDFVRLIAQIVMKSVFPSSKSSPTSCNDCLHFWNILCLVESVVSYWTLVKKETHVLLVAFLPTNNPKHNNINISIILIP